LRCGRVLLSRAYDRIRAAVRGLGVRAGGRLAMET
jgi:hypothetical protein